MAEGTWEKEGSFLSPTEEGEQSDGDQQLLLEKELAAQRLWQAFQESATAVAYLFKGQTFSNAFSYVIFVVSSVDVQERGGGSFWIPFHESASAVTQLYRGVCVCVCVCRFVFVHTCFRIHTTHILV